MKILVIGNGGREHAIAWKLAQSNLVDLVYVAPGNGGTASGNHKIKNIDLKNNHELIDFAKQNNIELTVVGPELPLSKGIVNDFHKHGLNIFGPTKEAAQLESSKDFAKAFMKKHQIPTADYQTFTEIKKAHAYILEKGAPIVIKADGLAAGKGVIVAQTEDEAIAAVNSMLADNKFGNAGARVVIEEFLTGEEASFIVIADGENILPLASSQDHKRLLNDDLGPNTGGMGAYSPAPIVDDALHEKIMNLVIKPTIKGMKKDGFNFVGFLYAGLMIDADKNIKTLEFNCRLGDPETQPLLFRIKSDLLPVLLNATQGKLNESIIEWEDGYSITVVMAAENYPNAPKLGDVISQLECHDSDCFIFHAGTKKVSEEILTSGGRVLGVTAKAMNLSEAQKKVYQLTKQIKFKGSQYRTDIGNKAFNRISEKS
jgi:phosphoribosylamine--glycine ligase